MSVDVPNIASSIENIPSPSPEIGNLLREGGLVTSPDELANITSAIQQNPPLLDQLRQDMQAASGDPIERKKAEHLYIKGLGQVVQLKDGTIMSFSDIAKLPKEKKDEVIAGMKRSGRSNFNDFELQAANHRIEIKKGVEQAANHSNQKKLEAGVQMDIALNQTVEKRGEVKEALNQEKTGLEKDQTALNQTVGKRGEVNEALNQERTNAETRCKSLVENSMKLMDDSAKDFVNRELQRVQSSPESSPIVQTLLRQGVKIEDIKSGQFNSTIETYIITANETKLTPQDPEKAKEFKQVVNQMRDTIGVPPTQGNIDKFAESKVLGSGRYATISAMREAGASGQYDRMTWDANSREVTMYQPNSDERLVIDTASEPPRKRIERAGLSIEREIDPPSPDDQKRSDITSQLTTVYETRRNIQIVPVLRTDPSEQYHQKELYTLALSHDPNVSLYQKIDAINELKQINTKSKEENLSNMLHNGIDPEPKHTQLEHEGVSLIQLESSYQREQSLNGALNQLPVKNPDQGDTHASETLSYLISLGYDHLGQENLDHLMNGLYARDGRSGIWNGGNINMQEADIREQQLRVLRQFAENISQKSGKNRNEALQDIANSLKGNETFRNIWKSPERLGIWIVNMINSPSSNQQARIDAPESPTPTL